MQKKTPNERRRLGGSLFASAELQANKNKLAGLQVPAGLSPNLKAAIDTSIGQAFVFGFRTVMLICAGLSLGSAAVAWFLIPRAGSPKTA